MKPAFEGEWNRLAYVLSAGCALYYAYVALVGITTPSLDRSVNAGVKVHHWPA